MPGKRTEVGKRLWDMGDELRANSKLKLSWSFFPVLGLTLLRYPDQGRDCSRRFTIQDLTLLATVRRILRKYGYPPDKQEKATLTVLEQVELLGWEVAA